MICFDFRIFYGLKNLEIMKNPENSHSWYFFIPFFLAVFPKCSTTSVCSTIWDMRVLKREGEKERNNSCSVMSGVSSYVKWMKPLKYCETENSEFHPIASEDLKKSWSTTPDNLDYNVTFLNQLPVMSFLACWGLVMPYGDTALGQHWFKQWLVVWWPQAITWTNVDLSLRSEFCPL